MTRSLPAFVLPIALLGLVAAACSSTPEATAPDPSNPCPPGQFCQAAAPTVTAPAPAPTTTPAPAGTSATAIAPVAAAAATPVLQGMASTEAPGMKPDGGAFAGQFQEGQTLEQPVNISPGKCYTIIGVGIGIQELDIQLVAAPAPNLPAIPLAQDNSTGAAATVGGKANGCWKNPTPLGGPGKVILKATKGNGIAAAQVYSK